MMVNLWKVFVISLTVSIIGSSCFPLSATINDKLKTFDETSVNATVTEEQRTLNNTDYLNGTSYLNNETSIEYLETSVKSQDNDKEDSVETLETASPQNVSTPHEKEELNNREMCFKLNKEFRDVRLAAYKKLDEIKNFVVLVEEYKIKNPETNFTELNFPIDIKEVQDFISGIDQYYNSQNKFVFIQGMDRRFISSQNGWYPMIVGDKPVPLGWEVFSIEEKGKNKIALKSRGKYVSSESGKRPLKCEKRSIGEHELFEMIDNHDETYSFKGSNGKYISSKPDHDHLFCNGDAVTANEKFTFLPIKSLYDEINISWKYYNAYLKELAQKYDKAINEKQKIELEKSNNYNETRAFESSEVAFKIYQLEETLEHEIYHFGDMLSSEVYRATKIDKMLTKLYPVLAFIQPQSNQHLSEEK